MSYDDEPRRWSEGLKLRPQDYARLGALLPHADRLAELADAIGNGGSAVDFSNDGTDDDDNQGMGPWNDDVDASVREKVLDFSYELGGTDDAVINRAFEAGADLGRLAAIQQKLDDRAALDRVRQQQDAEDEAARPRSDQQRLDRALGRIAQNTYLPDSPPRSGPLDPVLGYQHICGPSDVVTGRCASVYHDPSCSHVTESAAATGSYDEALAWRETLGRYASPDRLAEMGITHPKVQKTTGVHDTAVALGLVDTPGDIVTTRTMAGANAQMRAAMRPR